MPATPAPPGSSRFLFIDLLRGWAVFVMIETHIVNALLLPALKDQFAFTVLSFLNGLVAPAFLFCAGMALAIMLSRKWNEFVLLKIQFWKYCFRMVYIFIVAYSLHLPFFSYTRLANLTDAQAWSPFYQADILQVIALTLFVLVVMATILRRKTIFYPVIFLVWVAIIFLTPQVREMDTSALPVWLRPYLSTQVKSQFPLFPWAAFLIGGALVGALFIWMKRKLGEPKTMRFLLMSAIVMGGVALLVEYLPWTVYENHTFFKYSPEFFFVRFSLVLLGLAGLWYYTSGRSGGEKSIGAVFVQESLLVYVVHLLIVYGYTYEFSFIRMFGPTLNYLQCAELFVVLTAIMYVMAYIWHALKSWNKPIANTVQFAVLTVIVIDFFLKQT